MAVNVKSTSYTKTSSPSTPWTEGSISSTKFTKSSVNSTSFEPDGVFSLFAILAEDGGIILSEDGITGLGQQV